MFEVQVEKVMKAEEEKNRAMHEIADFLNKQIEELSNKGVDIYDEADTSAILSSFTWDEGEQMLKAQFD